jgi:hypothetical protein
MGTGTSHWPTGAARPREPAGAKDGSGRGRAFRGLALVFALSLLNLVGLILTITALGGTEPWTRWQFVGVFGLVEAASGLANVVSPNIWRLPIAELETGRRTPVRLAASAMLLPHWGGLARFAAGATCLAVAGWQEGVAAATVLLVPFVVLLAFAVVALSALLARAGVARPDQDVVQLVVRWGGRERELQPLSIGASVLQFLLSIATIPIAKGLPPTILFGPELAPSGWALLAALVGAVVLAVAVAAVWRGRTGVSAPRVQQREAEQHA